MEVAGRWFERARLDDDVTLIWEPHVDSFLRCNIWHVRGRDRDLIIDTGMGVASLAAALSDLIDKPIICVVSHAHADHVGSFHEFADRRMHRLDAPGMLPYRHHLPLVWAQAEPTLVAALKESGYEVERESLLTALPHADFDPARFRTQGAAPTAVLEEGSVIDLGDRRLEVLELPGHTPGSIGLWEGERRILFTGDALYDAPLIDSFPESDCQAYRATMYRLLTVPADIVHPGHDASFGRARMMALAKAYLEARD
ncbi:MAG: MBL fold metallo-hydrolase [Rhodospirillales bacterium]